MQFRHLGREVVAIPPNRHTGGVWMVLLNRQQVEQFKAIDAHTVENAEGVRMNSGELIAYLWALTVGREDA